MGVPGWIALGVAAALLANMALRQKITDASFQRPDLPRRSSGPAAGLPPAHQAIRPAGREHASPGHPRRITMKIVVVVVIALFLLGMALSARIVKQYEPGVLFRPTSGGLGLVHARRVSPAAESSAAIPPTDGPRSPASAPADQA